jgi:hypothetical protein
MSQPTVRFPVACPKCGRERLTELPVDVVADALQRGSDILLIATCHEVFGLLPNWNWSRSTNIFN